MKRILFVLLLALMAVPALIGWALAAPRFQADSDLVTDHGLVYRAWLPKDFSLHHHDVPLILFSHGFGGCAQQSGDITQALADHGYAVLAPDHKDKDCARWTQGDVGRMLTGTPDQPFSQPDKWNDQSHADRRADMEALLDFALTHAPYADALDGGRVAVMGHSLGGYTALAMGGAWPSWRDLRIRCVLALSPYAAPFVTHRTMRGLTVPVMFQTGTRDAGIGPVLLKQGGYGMAPSPKYLVVLDGAGHFAWTALNPTYQATIADYAVAFFDRELMHRPAPLLDQKASGQVSEYRHSS